MSQISVIELGSGAKNNLSEFKRRSDPIFRVLDSGDLPDSDDWMQEDEHKDSALIFFLWVLIFRDYRKQEQITFEEAKNLPEFSKARNKSGEIVLFQVFVQAWEKFDEATYNPLAAVQWLAARNEQE